MKTKEQRKAELLDALSKERHSFIAPTWLWEKYDEIESEKTLQQDPYADEVFGGRVSNVLRYYCRLNNRVDTLRLSQCPRISTLIRHDGIRGFGYKSWQEYREVMTKYGFTDKLT